MEEGLYEALVAFAAGGGLVGVLSFARWYIAQYWKRKDHKKQDGIKDLIRGISTIHEYLQDIVRFTKADRALIIHTHNCGGVPGPGKQVRCTVIHEITNGNVKPCIHGFQNWLCDAVYVDMLAELLQKGVVVLNTDEMPNSVLKDEYERIGVRQSVIRLLRIGEIGMYYASISLSEKHEFDPTERALIRNRTQQIEALLELYES